MPITSFEWEQNLNLPSISGAVEMLHAPSIWCELQNPSFSLHFLPHLLATQHGRASAHNWDLFLHLRGSTEQKQDTKKQQSPSGGFPSVLAMHNNGRCCLTLVRLKQNTHKPTVKSKLKCKKDDFVTCLKICRLSTFTISDKNLLAGLS